MVHWVVNAKICGKRKTLVELGIESARPITYHMQQDEYNDTEGHEFGVDRIE